MKSFYCFVCLLLVTACGPSDQGAVSHNASSQGQASERSSPQIREAVVVLHNLGFATQVDANNVITKWGTPHRILEKVVFLEEEKELSNNNRKALYVKIRRASGDEGWANKNYVIPDALPAVVISEKATFYRQPDNLNPGTQYLVQGDLIAILNDAVANNFVKVVYANPVTSALIANQFLKGETVTTTSEDIEAAVLLFLALRENNRNRRNELLKNAASTPSNIFSDKIQLEIQISEAGFNQEVLTQNNQLEVLAMGDVLNAPMDYGAVVGRVEPGKKVIALRKLTKDSQVWYQIQDPSGFILADFLSPPAAATSN